MDWTIPEGYSIPIGSSLSHGSPQEVSLVSFTRHLSSFTRKQLCIHTLLALAEDKSVAEIAEMLNLGQQTVRDYRNAFLLKGTTSLVSKRPPGRPSKSTKIQRRELTNLIKAGPQA